ncbi:MAG: 3-oxoacid CoA-transferase, partial [Acidimicrobiia bacterium]|nr:3-oxoacid CoA-transferase [Acidimicrobiia bacterium]
MTDTPSSLHDAVAEHVRAGDTLHLMVGHTRWTAAAREVVRQWWGRDPGFTLVMLSLSSLGTLFFRGGLVNKVITGYSGDTFPNFTPNPIFAGAYQRGEVEVEHWSFLAFSQRLEAAARGLPAMVTRSIAGSSMESNDGYELVDTPFGEVGLLSPLAADVALLHAPVADHEGNVAVHPPLLENVWGALGARRG